MRAGDVVWNPLTGEKALLVEGADDSHGAHTIADVAVESGGFVPGGEHVHDHVAEHFDVRVGRITLVLDGQERTLTSGEEALVAPGTWHRWWNPGEDEVLIRVRIEPALRFEEAILVLWGLCADGKTDAQWRPSPLLGALLATRLERAPGRRAHPLRRPSLVDARRLGATDLALAPARAGAVEDPGAHRCTRTVLAACGPRHRSASRAIAVTLGRAQAPGRRRRHVRRQPRPPDVITCSGRRPRRAWAVGWASRSR
jgi:mannose-6-phosphate isomerase-like protein (cupin superfamily)